MVKAAGNATDFLDAMRGAGIQAAAVDGTDAYRIDGISPKVVASPSDLDELGRVLRLASDQDMAVAPWGGGALTDIGNPPDRLDVVVDISGLDRVIEHNPADLTATVQAGVTLDRLQELLGRHGQFVALDPPLPRRSTVGGTLATAVSGPLKWQYGSPRDTVIGMKVVQPDGVVTKSGGQVVKNVSGYDMSRLHIGGLGTLGVIAEVSFKLTPRPASEATVVAAFVDPKRCVEAGLAVFHGEVMPLALTASDASAAGRMQTAGTAAAPFLAVRLGGRPLTLERQIREVRSICQAREPVRVEVLKEEDATALWRSLADFGWDRQTVPLVGVRAFVEPSATAQLVEAVGRSAPPEGLSPAIVCHPAHGTVLIGWNADGARASSDAVGEVVRDTRGLVDRLRGKMVVERCPLDVKSGLDVWGSPPEPVAIMRGLKEQYDPKRTLNPGRYVGGI